jgi:hypothetical protein
MTLSETIGTIGVSLLLIAFALNLLKWLKADSIFYLGLNTLGASISMISALMIPFWPFVVLEGVWGLVSVVGLLRAFKKRGEKKADKSS